MAYKNKSRHFQPEFFNCSPHFMAGSKRTGGYEKGIRGTKSRGKYAFEYTVAMALYVVVSDHIF